MSNHPLPILYSFRRCPYAMRARLAIANAGFHCQIREILLRDKPEHMLEISPKGTVPVLQLCNGDVIDESLDIMMHVLHQQDPHHWLWRNADQEQDIKTLLHHNDGAFKTALDRYKYTDRYADAVYEDEQEKCRLYLSELQNHIAQNGHLCGKRATLADWAIMPFIRQCRIADPIWFDALDLPELHNWLNGMLKSDLFNSVMQKLPQWHMNDPIIVFPS